MTECYSGNVRLSDSSENKLMAVIVLTLRLLSDIRGTNENNFPHNLLLTNRQVARLHNAFTNSL